MRPPAAKPAYIGHIAKACTPPADAPGRFGSVRRSIRLPDQLSEQIVSRIVAVSLTNGERLASENRLCENFGVSRPVVRDAIFRLARGHSPQRLILVQHEQEAIARAIRAGESDAARRLMREPIDNARTRALGGAAHEINQEHHNV